jgi:small subunit ribosomal protein S5
MAELLDETSQIESTTVGVSRTSATVKGGRRFSFGALVVVGDRRGKVGFGYGKSNEVPSAIEKAQKYARRAMRAVPMAGTTIHHEVEGTFGASKVRLIPAAPGTGVVAGGTIRAVLEMAGVTDCLTKCYGSTNSRNIIKACFLGLDQLRPPEAVAALRGVELEKTTIQTKLEKGAKFMTAPRKPRPQLEERGGGGRGRGGPGGGRGRGGPGGGRGGGGGRGPGGPRTRRPETQSPDGPATAAEGGKG